MLVMTLFISLEYYSAVPKRILRVDKLMVLSILSDNNLRVFKWRMLSPTSKNYHVKYPSFVNTSGLMVPHTSNACHIREKSKTEHWASTSGAYRVWSILKTDHNLWWHDMNNVSQLKILFVIRIKKTWSRASLQLTKIKQLKQLI